jgi:hypothetical protein
MSGDEDQLGVVIAPGTAEEANRCQSTLRAAGFHPIVDYGSAADRLGNFPVLVPLAELGEAKGFLRGLRAAQPAAEPALAVMTSAVPVAARAPAGAWRSGRNLPAAGGALALLTGLLVIAGGIAVLVSMLHFLSSLRDH